MGPYGELDLPGGPYVRVVASGVEITIGESEGLVLQGIRLEHSTPG